MNDRHWRIYLRALVVFAVAMLCGIAGFVCVATAYAQDYDAQGLALRALSLPNTATTWTKPQTAPILDSGGAAMNVLAIGAKCDGRYVTGTGITVTAGSTAATVESGRFTTADIGKTIQIDAISYQGTITAIVDATHITLSAAPASAVSAADYFYATDDTAALTAYIATLSSATASLPSAPLRSLLIPAAHICLTDTLYLRSSMDIWGYGGGNFAMSSVTQRNASSGLRAKANLTGPGVVTQVNYFATNVGLHYLAIDGAKAQQTSAKSAAYILASPTSEDTAWFFDHVNFFGASGSCLYAGMYNRAQRVESSTMWQCGGAGIDLQSTDNLVNKTIVGQNGGAGIISNGGTNHFSDNDIFNNTGAGIIIPYSAAHAFLGSVTAGNYTITLNNGTAYTTSALAYNASAATVQAAIRGLATAFANVTVAVYPDGTTYRVEGVPPGTAISADLTGLTTTSAVATKFYQSVSADNRIMNNSIDDNGNQGIFVSQPRTIMMGNRFTGNSNNTNGGYAVIDLNYTVAPTPAGSILIGNVFVADQAVTNKPSFCIRLAGGALLTAVGNYSGSETGACAIVSSNVALSPGFNSLALSQNLNFFNSQTMNGYSDALGTTRTFTLNAGTGGLSGLGLMTFGANTAATGYAGEVAQAKVPYASTTAPNAGFCKLSWIAGTNSGTGKLIATCGTSTTATTVVDNVGAGF